jgi:uncharacterized protein YpmB
MRKIKNKKTQSEVITTVILILVSIAAVTLVATFVVSMVRNNLKSTDCFQTTGQLQIKVDNSYFNETNEVLYVVIQRGTNAFNLSGISVVFGNEQETKKIQAIDLTSDERILNPSLGKLDPIILPKTGESSLFRINTSNFNLDTINVVAVSPMINKHTECESVDEKQISVVS